MVLASAALMLGMCLPGQAQNIASPPAPAWSAQSIKASRSQAQARAGLPDTPAALFQGMDMMNLFIVVEADGRHVAVVDGDRLEPIHRFTPRHALHGAPAFTPDGRHMFYASRDGWISKFDIWNLQVVAEARVGTDTRNLALSGDGKYVAVANREPHTLVLLDSDLNPLKVHHALNKNRTQSSPVLAVHDATARRSFVAVLEVVPEVWEMSYNPTADDVPIGVIHDFLYKEGAFIPGFLNPHRSYLSEAITDFAFTPSHDELLSANPETGKAQVIHLDVRKRIVNPELPGRPRLGSGANWKLQPRPQGPQPSVMAVADRHQSQLSIIDLETWATIKTIPMAGPGRYVRSHEATPYAWVDAMGPNQTRDTLQVIDKRTLERVADIRPAPDKALGQLEFTRDGRHVLASLQEREADGGALVVFDAASFKELKRISLDRPAELYNLHNRIARPVGTAR